MVIYDLDIERVLSLPAKADPPLLVNADAMLPGAISLQSFQVIARGRAQVVQATGFIQQQELASSHALNPGWESSRGFILKQALRLRAGKASYHRDDYNARRYTSKPLMESDVAETSC
jgi:hypothetical protein